MTKKIIALMLLAIGLTACGGGGTTPTKTDASGLGKFSMDFKTKAKTEVKKDFEVKKGVFVPLAINVDSKPIIRYIIELTDFDFDPNSSSAKPKDEKQSSIEIALFGDEGDTAETPLRVKTFEVAPPFAKVDAKYGKVSNVAVTIFKDGKPEETSLSYDAKGTVKINSVAGDTITGEVDLTQNSGAKIKGNFTAQMKKKQ